MQFAQMNICLDKYYDLGHFLKVLMFWGLISK